MSIPRALNLNNPEDGGDKIGQSQWIETRQVRPSSFSQSQVRFLLPTSGVMQADGFLQLQLVTSANTMYQPISTGIFSCIDSATFSIGGTQICQTRGLGHRYTMTNKFRSSRERQQQQQVRSGTCDSLMTGETIAEAAPAVTFSAGCWEPNIGTGAIEAKAFGNPALTKDARRISGSYQFQSTVGNSPIFRVYIADLFPGLAYFNLPLELFPRAQIVINFTPDLGNGYRCLGVEVAGNPAFAPGNNIQESTCVMHVSLAHFDDPVDTISTMDEIAKEFESGLRLPFTDDSYQRVNKAAVATGSKSLEVLMRLDNERVRSIMVATPRAAVATVDGNNRLQGIYYSEKSEVSSSFQMSINSAQVFPSPLNTPALQYAEFSQIFQMPASINSAKWSYLGQTTSGGVLDNNACRITNKPYMGWKCRDHLPGRSGYYGVNLSSSYSMENGVGTKIAPHVPVVLSITEEAGSAGIEAKLVHVWAVCERMLALQQGKAVVTGS